MFSPFGSSTCLGYSVLGTDVWQQSHDMVNQGGMYLPKSVVCLLVVPDYVPTTITPNKRYFGMLINHHNPFGRMGTVAVFVFGTTNAPKDGFSWPVIRKGYCVHVVCHGLLPADYPRKKWVVLWGITKRFVY